MKIFISDLANYLKELFAEGRRRLFTAFDVLGIILFLFPSWAQRLTTSEPVARTIGLSILFISFFLANFSLYRKSRMTFPSPEENLLLHPYHNPPYNDAEIQYIGDEIMKDVEVSVAYTDKDGVAQSRKISEFFPEKDTQLIGHSSDIHALKKGDLYRFHVAQKESTSDFIANVIVEFVGTSSGKRYKKEQVFKLNL